MDVTQKVQTMNSVAATMQATEDANYAKKLADFNASIPDWQNRAQDAYFKGLALPPAPQPPTKVVLSSNADGTGLEQTVTDMGVKPPVFTPPTTVAHPTGSIAATNAGPSQLDRIEAMLLVLLQRG